MTLNFGLFPKMFKSTSGDSLFDQEINLANISNDLAMNEDIIKETGAIIKIDKSFIREN